MVRVLHDTAEKMTGVFIPTKVPFYVRKFRTQGQG